MRGGVTITWDKSKLTALTKQELSRQMDFAVAQTLTGAAFEARKDTQTHLKRRLNIKKNFLPGSVVVNRATRQRLESEVGFLDRAVLVNLLEQGGKRQPFRARRIAVPSQVVNKRGNIPPSKRPRRVVPRDDTFIGTINGTYGIWQRYGKNRVKLLYSLTPATTYKPRQIQFQQLVAVVAPRYIERNLWKNLVRALESRRR